MLREALASQRAMPSNFHPPAHPGFHVDPAPAGQAGEQPDGTWRAPGPQPGETAQSLGDYLRGALLYEQNGGPGGAVTGPHMHDGSQAASHPHLIHTERGVASEFSLGQRKFHIYFTRDGRKQVIEIKKHPQE